MSDPMQVLTESEITAAVPIGWRHEGDTLEITLAAGDFATGLALVDRVGAAAEEAQHHPDVLLTYPQVTVTLTSHDAGGVTSRDVDLAHEVTAIAATLGVTPAED